MNDLISVIVPIYCVEEFLPDWQEQNEEITGYSLQYFELDEETGDGYVDIVLE